MHRLAPKGAHLAARVLPGRKPSHTVPSHTKRRRSQPSRTAPQMPVILGSVLPSNGQFPNSGHFTAQIRITFTTGTVLFLEHSKLFELRIAKSKQLSRHLAARFMPGRKPSHTNWESRDSKQLSRHLAPRVPPGATSERRGDNLKGFKAFA